MKSLTAGANHRLCSALILAVSVLALAGCAGGATPAAGEGANLPEGWVLAGEERLYDSDTIFELVNGQADAYFAYNFEQVAVRRYEDEGGAVVEVETWRVATPGDAYGLFTSNRAGEPIEIGNGGDADAGRRVAFWQDRYYVRIRSRQETSDELLHALAAATAAGLPAGGDRPALVGQLPPEGLIPDSILFFHLENSIQSELWLGGKNILGLDLETIGVLGRYDVGGAEARLLLIEYADADAAHAAQTAFQAAALDGYVASDVQAATLAAIFGDIAETDGSALVADALSSG